MIPTSSRFSSPALPVQNHATQPAGIVPGIGQARSAAAASKPEWQRFSQRVLNGALRIENEKLGLGDIRDCADWLASSPAEMHTMVLWNVEMDDAGAALLSEALKVNTTLASLDLGENEICASGVESLMKALRVNKTLATLHVHGSFACIARTPSQLNPHDVWTFEVSDAPAHMKRVSDDLARNRQLRDDYKAACVGLEFASGLAYPPELMSLILDQLIFLPSIAKQDALLTMESCIKSIPASETTTGIAAATSGNLKPAPCTLI